MKRNVKWLSILLAMVMLMSCILVGCDDSDRDHDDRDDNDDRDDGFPTYVAGDNDDDDDDNDNNDDVVMDKVSDVSVSRGLVTGAFFQVEFEKEGVTYCGIANDKGEILYYTPYSSTGRYFWGINFVDMGEGAGYLTETKDDGPVYTIINSKGVQKSFTSADFDAIIGASGGYLLVYKNTGNISKEEHSYGLINGKGEWERPLTPGAYLPYEKPYTHVGDKTFVQYNYYGNNDHYIVFDAVNNTTIGFDGCVIKNNAFNKGSYFVNSNSWFADFTKPYDAYSTDSTELSAGTYLFNKDGTYKAIDKSIEMASDKVAVYWEDEVLKIWNLESNTKVTFDMYSQRSAYLVKCVGENILLNIAGKDGKGYFAVINAKGEQLFEPKVHIGYATHLNFLGDRTVYVTPDGYYTMVDNQGKTLISENAKYTEMATNGWGIKAVKDDVTYLLDRDGKEVSFALVKNTVKG